MKQKKKKKFAESAQVITRMHGKSFRTRAIHQKDTSSFGESIYLIAPLNLTKLK